MSNPDINDLMLADVVVETSATPEEMEKFFDFQLPDDGDHLAVVRLGDRGVIADRQKSKTEKDGNGNPLKNGTLYITAHIAARILDPQTLEEKAMVFDNPNSLPFGKASRLHAVLFAAVGADALEKRNLAELKEFTQTTLAQSPRETITTQWIAQIKDPDGSYRTVCKGQKNFPPILDGEGNPTGKYNSTVVDVKTGTAVDAQVKIVSYEKA